MEKLVSLISYAYFSNARITRKIRTFFESFKCTHFIAEAASLRRRFCISSVAAACNSFYEHELFRVLFAAVNIVAVGARNFIPVQGDVTGVYGSAEPRRPGTGNPCAAQFAIYAFAVGVCDISPDFVVGSFSVCLPDVETGGSASFLNRLYKLIFAALCLAAENLIALGF